MIELKEKGGGEMKAGKESVPSTKGRRSRSSTSSLSWRHLKPITRYDQPLPSSSHESSESEEEEWSNEVWGAKGGRFKEIENYIAYEKLVEQIDSILSYPQPLTYRNITGTVNVRLFFDPLGHCQWNRSTFKSSSSPLRVYVKKLLKKLCDRNFAVRTMKGIEFVDLAFHFHDNKKTADPSDPKPQVVGGVLLFERAYNNKLLWRAGPLRGSFLTPTVMLDMEWVGEMLNKMEGIDPMDEFRE